MTSKETYNYLGGWFAEGLKVKNYGNRNILYIGI